MRLKVADNLLPHNEEFNELVLVLRDSDDCLHCWGYNGVASFGSVETSVSEFGSHLYWFRLSGCFLGEVAEFSASV